MAFTSLCTTSELHEGEMRLLRVNRKSVLLVWPKDDTVYAYRGRCPHQDVPLDHASFDGKTITCNHHRWYFDAATGERVAPRDCELKAYAVRIENDTIQVDLA